MAGQRPEVMIKLGSQYYDASDASIDYEWAVVITFASQACYLYHRLDLCIIGLWEAMQLKPCRDFDVGDVGVGCIILA